MSLADDQRRVVLTSHPLQRVGAIALARLVAVNGPDRVGRDAFEAAALVMAEDALTAALARDTKLPTGPGFWLKSSHSLFPNSKMNHPAQAKKDDGAIEEGVRAWRRMPTPDRWPGASCVLCGRTAAGFFGKRDVPLAESDSYRNTTPRGHDGMALCWPCVCCFYALPYGCCRAYLLAHDTLPHQASGPVPGDRTGEWRPGPYPGHRCPGRRGVRGR